MEDDAATSAALTAAVDRRLLVFLGKGGVGKSTLAAAMARLLARRGKRVLLCEASGGGRLAGMLGAQGSPPDDEGLQAVTDNLTLCDIQPRPALREYAVMKLKVARVVDRLLDNALVQSFLRLLPSLSETVTLGKLLYHVREETHGRPRFDAVVFDAPATGHALSLLELPQVLRHTVPPGPLRDDMIWMNDLLVDPAMTTLIPCTLAEELPVNETLELESALRDHLKLRRDVCLANAVWPHRFESAELGRLRASLSPELFDVAARFERRAELNRAQLRRLRAQLDLPVLELPLVFDSEHLLARLETELTARLSARRPDQQGTGRRVS